MNYRFNNKILKELDKTKYSLIRQCSENNNHLCVLLVSAERKEGVTTITSHLAESISELSNIKLLLIDGNIDRPHLKPFLKCNENYQENTDGLDIIKTSSFSILTLTKDSNVKDSSDLNNILKQLKNQYNIILIDAGSLLASPPIIFSKSADNTILIVDAIKNNIHRLARVRQEMKNQNIDLTGVILNRRKFYIPSFLYRYL